MTDLIKRDDALAALNSWTYRCDAEDAIRALPAVDPVVIHQVDPAAIREAALREAADVADVELMRWGFPSIEGCRRDEMHTAILALIGEKK